MGHPWRIPLSVENQLESQPPFWTQLWVPVNTVETKLWKCDSKLKISRASCVNVLDNVDKVFEKSKATSAPGLLLNWVHTISAQNVIASKRAAYDKRAWQCLISAHGSV